MSTAPARLHPLVLTAIIVTILAWASAFIVIRGTGPHFTGGALALGRLAVGAVLLGIVVLAGRRWVRPTAREWLLIVIYGVAWFGAYNVALNIAEHTLDAGTTAMIVGVGPILIALGAGLFLGEGIPKWLAIGAAVAFVGVVLIGAGFPVLRVASHDNKRAGVIGGADLVLGVQGPAVADLPGIKAGTTLAAILSPFADRVRIDGYAQAGINAFAMEFMPRITRAQSMDVLSSQANLAG